MHAQIGRAEKTFRHGQLSHHRCGIPFAVQMGVRLERGAAQLFLNADPAQDLHGIGHHLNASPNAGERGSLFVNLHAHPGAQQCRRCRHSTDSRADDGDRKALQAHFILAGLRNDKIREQRSIRNKSRQLSASPLRPCIDPALVCTPCCQERAPAPCARHQWLSDIAPPDSKRWQAYRGTPGCYSAQLLPWWQPQSLPAYCESPLVWTLPAAQQDCSKHLYSPDPPLCDTTSRLQHRQGRRRSHSHTGLPVQIVPRPVPGRRLYASTSRPPLYSLGFPCPGGTSRQDYCLLYTSPSPRDR